MSGLSYGVVRVDQENSLTSLTLQDCGQVMPGCKYFYFLFHVYHWLSLCRFVKISHGIVQIITSCVYLIG